MPQDKPPRKPDNRKYNRKRVIQLAEKGVPPTLIAKDQAVAVSTITRYLEKIAPQLRDIAHFSKHKTNILALSQLQNITIESYIKSKWLENPESITSQDIRVQKEILHTLQGGRYYDYQAERLETGQSTGNIAVIIDHIESLQRQVAR